ncbi:MAG: D-tyrosyl-tRNA(Tyr) deacylase [Ruminococcaceae bacterium]|nr:D-tyrosyl-tRNA(Tyr) deacylase [Oscillospiraceae bacterium]
MTAILQRVSFASVSVDGEVKGKAAKGMMILLGCAVGDTHDDADLLCSKIAGLRIFEDENMKMNLALSDIDGEVLLIPNFTLSASCRRGRRPDFGNCMKPDEAKPMFDYFRDKLIDCGLKVETGVFGADMKIDMCCDGPVTISLDSDSLKAPRNI